MKDDRRSVLSVFLRKRIDGKVCTETVCIKESLSSSCVRWCCLLRVPFAAWPERWAACATWSSRDGQRYRQPKGDHYLYNVADDHTEHKQGRQLNRRDGSDWVLKPIPTKKGWVGCFGERKGEKQWVGALKWKKEDTKNNKASKGVKGLNGSGIERVTKGHQ